MSELERPNGARENWRQASPEVKELLTELAFRSNSSFTHEMQAHIQSNVIEDLRDDIAQGGNNG